MSPVRLGAVDVGTNSTRLLVGDVVDGVMVAEHAREMVITRLGKGVDRSGRFDPAALARTLEVLAGYAATCRRLGVERRRLVATSATRDAADRQVFLDGVRDLLGVEPEVLTGQAEAAAAYRGATAGLGGDRRTLVVDIGGGSTELIDGDGTTPRAMVSLDIGCVRLFERHLHTDPPTPAEVAALFGWAISRSADRALRLGAGQVRVKGCRWGDPSSSTSPSSVESRSGSPPVTRIVTLVPQPFSASASSIRGSPFAASQTRRSPGSRSSTLTSTTPGIPVSSADHRPMSSRSSTSSHSSGGDLTSVFSNVDTGTHF